jgi:hypothetical protein
MIWALWRIAKGQSIVEERLLAWLSLPCVALLTIQALFGGANANWAVPAYVAGTVLATAILRDLSWPVMWASLVINGLAAFLVSLLTVFPTSIKLPSGELAMKRFVGRSGISRFASEVASRTNIRIIVADNRPILADLFYTLRYTGLRIHAKPGTGFPANYYEQIFALPADVAGTVLYISESNLTCQGNLAAVAAEWRPPFGYRKGHVVHAYAIDTDCLRPQSDNSPAQN